MGKKKKLGEKLKEFYRGVPAKPGKDASETDIETIIGALKSCIPNKNCLFSFHLNGKSIHMRLCVGLREGLRYLKRKQTWALIYDDTADQYLQNYLNEFASKSCVPTVRAKGLIDIAPKLKLNSMLLISLVIFDSSTDAHKVIESLEFAQLCDLLCEIRIDSSQNANFKLPTIEKISANPRRTKLVKERKLKSN